MKTRAGLGLSNRKGKKTSPKVRKTTALERDQSVERRNSNRKVALILPESSRNVSTPTSRTSPDITAINARVRSRKAVEAEDLNGLTQDVRTISSKECELDSVVSASETEEIVQLRDEPRPPILQNESSYEVETQLIGSQETIPDIMQDVYEPLDVGLRKDELPALSETQLLQHEEKLSSVPTTPRRELSFDHSESNSDDPARQLEKMDDMESCLTFLESRESRKAESEIGENTIFLSCEIARGGRGTTEYWTVKINGLTEMPFLRSIAEIKVAADQLPEVDQIIQFNNADNSVTFTFYTNLLIEDIPEPPEKLVNKINDILQSYIPAPQIKEIKCSQILWTR